MGTVLRLLGVWAGVSAAISLTIGRAIARASDGEAVW